MISELGHFALTLAFFVACIQCVVPLIGAMTGRAALMALAAPAASAHFFLILGSFLALMHAFITSDFTVRLVALNSHSLKPMIYKISLAVGVGVAVSLTAVSCDKVSWLRPVTSSSLLIIMLRIKPLGIA